MTTSIDSTKDHTADPELNVSSSGATMLSTLREELRKKVSKDPIVLPVPERPNFKIKFDVNIESGLLQQWRKISNDKSMPGQFDQLKFSSIIIANQAEILLVNDVEAYDETGNAYNFKNKEVWDMLGTASARPAVKAMYGLDGHIFQVAEKVLEAGGYGTDEVEEDDTFLGQQNS